MNAKKEALANEGPGMQSNRVGDNCYGDFERLGVSVEWHDFRTEQPLDWGRSFHARSLEFCLNLQGRGAVAEHAGARSEYSPEVGLLCDW